MDDINRPVNGMDQDSRKSFEKSLLAIDRSFITSYDSERIDQIG